MFWESQTLIEVALLKKKIDLENSIKKGDIVIYNVKNNHGVEKIIKKNSNIHPDSAENSKFLNGRISLLITPYLIKQTLKEKVLDPCKFKSWIYK